MIQETHNKIQLCNLSNIFCSHARLEVFTAMKVDVVVFRVVTPLVSYHITTRCRNIEDHDMNFLL